MAGNIFISYRRDDAAAWAGRLHMALERHFSREQIFMDVDSIQAGLDFAKVIDAEVAKCDVMLVVIGKGWLDAADAAGRRRLDDPGDFVRLEVESALRRDIRVVPVLVDGAGLPKAEQLPEGMQGLARRQAWPLSHARFGAESEGLIDSIPRCATRYQQDDVAISLTKGVLYAVVGVFFVLALGVLGRQLGSDIDNPLFSPTWAGIGGTVTSMLLMVTFWNRLSSPQLLGLGIALCASLPFNYWQFIIPHTSFMVNQRLGTLLVTVMFSLVSGPALVLWRRRKRGG